MAATTGSNLKKIVRRRLCKSALQKNNAALPDAGQTQVNLNKHVDNHTIRWLRHRCLWFMKTLSVCLISFKPYIWIGQGG